MNIYFELLSKDNYEESLDVLNKIFPDDVEIARRHYDEFLDKNNPAWRDERFWQYYVVKGDDKKIIALTGLYNSYKHEPGDIWLGWYGVLPDYRGKGVGREVLKLTMEKAREMGYKKFKLWTTTDTGEENAQRLYDDMNIKIYNKIMHEGGEYEILYREVNL